jgi:hypothetical protein
MTYLVFFAAPILLTLVLMLAVATDPGTRWRIQSRKPAERRGIAPLRSWLTPEQAEQWDARGEFEVVGCDTGTRYRITRGTMMNVLQLDRTTGKAVAEWCFRPEGKLAVGDVLLAQKIALEKMESRALASANAQSHRG